MRRLWRWKSLRAEALLRPPCLCLFLYHDLFLEDGWVWSGLLRWINGQGRAIAVVKSWELYGCILEISVPESKTQSGGVIRAVSCLGLLCLGGQWHFALVKCHATDCMVNRMMCSDQRQMFTLSIRSRWTMHPRRANQY